MSMKEDTANTKSTSLSFITIAIFVLYIIRHFTHIITEGIKLATPETLNYNGVQLNIVNHTVALYNIAVSVIFVIIMICILQKRKWAVISFFAFQFVNAIAICIIQNNVADFGGHLLASVVCCIIFSLLLCIRNEGVSGWKLFFQPSLGKKHKNDKILVANTSTEDIIHKVEPQSKADNIEEVSNHENIKLDKLHHKKRTYNRKWILYAIGGISTFTLLISLTFGYYAYNTPERQYAKADTLLSHGQINEALDIYRNLADEDNYIPAKTKLGILYLTNDSVPMDSIVGFKYLEESAITDTTALKYLIYLYGGREYKGVTHTNTTKAYKYAQMALQQKKCTGAANLCLGYMNMNEEKYELSYYYLSEASKNKEPHANAFIGYLYLYGYGCEEDNEKAREYFEKELQIGQERNASYFLGLMYKEGWGVDINTHKAIKYLRMSAKLGDDSAKEELAKMKINGDYNEELFEMWEE
jgi:TPR repeat protein